MAYTTPSTVTAGQVLTASYLNTYVRDNVAWLATDSPTVRAYNSTTFSHNSSGNELALTLNSERFDNAAMHSTSSNTSRITAPTGGGGKYLIGAVIGWAISGVGNQRQIRFKLNATTYLGRDTRTPSASHGSESTPVTVYTMAAADYVEVYAMQDSGGTLAVSSGEASGPEVYAFWFRV